MSILSVIWTWFPTLLALRWIEVLQKSLQKQVCSLYRKTLKHKSIDDSPWLAIYDNHGFDPCSGQVWETITILKPIFCCYFKNEQNLWQLHVRKFYSFITLGLGDGKWQVRCGGDRESLKDFLWQQWSESRVISQNFPCLGLARNHLYMKNSRMPFEKCPDANL